MSYYYMMTDENGVDVVDVLGWGDPFTEEKAAKVAEDFPDAIYFEYPEVAS